MKKPRRERRAGVALIWAMVMAAICLTLMTGFVSLNSGSQRLAAGLAGAYREDLAKSVILERLKPQIALAMENSSIGSEINALPLDGTPFMVEVDGRVWTVRIQDVEGLIDPYLASDELLAQMSSVTGLAQRRQAMLSQLPPGGRYEPIDLTIRYLEIPAEFQHLFTQSSSFGYPRFTTAPSQLKSEIRGLAPGFRDSEQIKKVSITISRD